MPELPCDYAKNEGRGPDGQRAKKWVCPVTLERATSKVGLNCALDQKNQCALIYSGQEMRNITGAGRAEDSGQQSAPGDIGSNASRTFEDNRF